MAESAMLLSLTAYCCVALSAGLAVRLGTLIRRGGGWSGSR